MTKFLAIGALALLTASSAFAGSQSGRIKTVTLRASDGLVYFVLDGPRVERPGCNTGDYWMIKDENSPAGKRQLALLLAARTSQQPISVVGTGTCTRWPDGEDVNEIYM
ncbi:hypothetical protein [Mitsuaria sp. GD03876]|uniref:hypothetical protein n=1 Tax=Mitsuaria sp. GD03876 TaxID=2975399 RepID=UPI002449A24D|nr:hypothetical protein [Mitsuaria sp. GD03876]MDH0867079.1 hypothetical protein [Mitsuaria sp. GD03876]